MCFHFVAFAVNSQAAVVHVKQYPGQLSIVWKMSPRTGKGELFGGVTVAFIYLIRKPIIACLK